MGPRTADACALMTIVRQVGSLAALATWLGSLSKLRANSHQNYLQARSAGATLEQWGIRRKVGRERWTHAL